MITIIIDYPVILSFFLCIFYKAVNNLVVSIDSEALPVPRQLMRSTRSASSNAITSIPKQSRTVTDQHSFFISVYHTWNILPAELCTSYISLASFNYYSTHDFPSNHDIHKSSLDSRSFSAPHCNIRSLQGNYDNLAHMLSELQFSFSVIGLSETKFMTNKDILTNLDLPGYDFISQPSLSNAGGVGFYVKNNLTYSILSNLTTTESDFEALWIKINVKGQSNLICGVVYRHPNSNFDNFMIYMNRTIEQIHAQEKYTLIMGDFNINILDSNQFSDDFINTLGSFFFQTHILQPNRITNHTATLIDNIIFNSIEHFIISGNIVYDLTDHLPNFIIFSNFGSLPSSIKIYTRDYSKFNETALIEEVQSIEWHAVLSSDSNPSNMFDLFYSKLSGLADNTSL